MSEAQELEILRAVDRAEKSGDERAMLEAYRQLDSFKSEPAAIMSFEQFKKDQSPMNEQERMEAVKLLEKQTKTGGQFGGVTLGHRMSNPDYVPDEIMRERYLRYLPEGDRALIEGTTPVEAFNIGAGRGLYKLGRGVGLVEPETQQEKEQYERLSAVMPTAEAGELAGETAPFLLPGSAVAAIPKTGARALGMFGLGASEGGIIASGEGRGSGEIITSGVISGLTAGSLDMAMPYIRSMGGKIIRRVFGKDPESPAFDSAGNPSAEMIAALDQTGQTVDDVVADSIDNIPEEIANYAPSGSLPQDLQSITDSVQRGANQRVFGGRERQQGARELAAQVDPQIETINAAESLGMAAESVPPEVLSGNQAFRELAGTARSVPGSPQSSQYRQFMDDFGRTAEEALGAAESADVINIRIPENLSADIDRATKLSNDLYTEVDEIVSREFGAAAEVDPKRVQDVLMSELDSVGGDVSKLTKTEQQLFKRFFSVVKEDGGGEFFQPKKETWASISKLRRELNEGAFTSGSEGASRGEQKRYAGLVSGTQKDAAESLGVSELYQQALDSTGAKKALKEAQQALMGRDLNKSLTAVMDSKGTMLAKGRVAEFRDFIAKIPEEEQGAVVLSFLRQKIKSGVSMDDRVNTAGFNKFYQGLVDHPAAKDELFKHLDPDERGMIESIGRVTQAVKRANEDAIKTGRIKAADSNFNLSDGILGKVISVARFATGGTMAAADVAVKATAKKDVQLREAASAMMDSKKFQVFLNNVIDDAKSKKSKYSERVLMVSPEWKKFMELADSDVSKAAATQGAIVWMMPDRKERKRNDG